MKYLLFIFLPIYVFSQSAYDIMKMVDDRPSPRSLINRAKMTLENSKGRSREYSMISQSIDQNSKQMIWFLEPKDDRGIAFLKIENDGKEDEMRMWLPAFKKIRRISARKKGDSFMGSDLSYEDLSSRELDDSYYKRLDDEMLFEEDCFVIETIPKEETNSFYSKHISWIDKHKLILLSEHSFNKKGLLEKKKEFKYIKFQDYHLVKRVLVDNIIEQHKTEILFSDVKIDKGVENDSFHEKNLKRLPMY